MRRIHSYKQQRSMAKTFWIITESWHRLWMRLLENTPDRLRLVLNTVLVYNSCIAGQFLVWLVFSQFMGFKASGVGLLHVFKVETSGIILSWSHLSLSLSDGSDKLIERTILWCERPHYKTHCLLNVKVTVILNSLDWTWINSLLMLDLLTIQERYRRHPGLG